ncbi:hypothetical protein PENTCL1PPCAC_30475, partial [Pristionchus entomophagus]
RMPWWCSLICYGILIVAALLIMLSRSIRWNDKVVSALSHYGNFPGDLSSQHNTFYDRATIMLQ